MLRSGCRRRHDQLRDLFRAGKNWGSRVPLTVKPKRRSGCVFLSIEAAAPQACQRQLLTKGVGIGELDLPRSCLLPLRGDRLLFGLKQPSDYGSRTATSWVVVVGGAVRS